jgi:stearoyl-CoA desaturase (delta-9 desaturase)
MYICIFKAVGLCKVRRVAPKPQIEQSRQVDLETLQAVLVNRMHVMREYTQKVTLPVLKTEHLAERGNAVLAKVRKLLVVHPERLDATARKRLSNVLENNQSLKKVYELREQLIQIWGEANVSNERLIEALKEWCAAAESSGIRALEEFSERLRGYMLQPVRV